MGWNMGLLDHDLYLIFTHEMARKRVVIVLSVMASRCSPIGNVSSTFRCNFSCSHVTSAQSPFGVHMSFRSQTS